LQTLNNVAPEFGELGHYAYAFMRVDADRGQAFLIVVNLNPASAYQPHVRVSSEALNRARLPTDATNLALTDRLSAFTAQLSAHDLINIGAAIDLPPSTARVLELKVAQ
jgi:hypothetical protein